MSKRARLVDEIVEADKKNLFEGPYDKFFKLIPFGFIKKYDKKHYFNYEGVLVRFDTLIQEDDLTYVDNENGLTISYRDFGPQFPTPPSHINGKSMGSIPYRENYISIESKLVTIRWPDFLWPKMKLLLEANEKLDGGLQAGTKKSKRRYI